MAKESKTKPVIPPIITQQWVAQQFEDLTDLILAEFEKLTKLLGGGNNVTPALEQAVKRTQALVITVDRKVPDNPATTT